MNQTKALFTAVILLSILHLPLRAQPALEQVKALVPETEIAIPLPEAAAPVPAGLSPEEVAKKLRLFDYQKTDVISVKRNVPAEHNGYSTEIIELLVNDPLRQLGEYKQQYRFYKTIQAGPRPTVLVYTPFSGAKTLDAWTAVHFAKKGYNAVVIMPSESLTDKTRPIDKTDDLLIRESIAARMCIDLIETFPEVNKKRVYATGISMGGIRTVLAFGVEPRIKKAAEVVGGGDIPGIIADTHFVMLTKTRNARMKIEGIANLADFRAYMEKVMTVDPLDFASLRNPEDLMVVMGKGDRFVPDVYQKKLYDAFSRPQEGRYPVLLRSGTGHIVTAFEIGKYVDKFAEFFGS
jgi:dienelactone hydrolase